MKSRESGPPRLRASTISVPERLKAASLAAANVAAFVGAASLFTSNLVSFSHHWLFPVHEFALLIQGLIFSRKGRFSRTLTLLSALVFSVAGMRLVTIVESGHLFHLFITLLAGAGLHALLALSAKSPWRRVNRAASVVLTAAAAAAGWKALGEGIDFGV